MRCEGGKVTDTYEQLISIDTDVPQTIQTLTRIRPEHLEDKPKFEDVREEILKHIGDDALIVGQNIPFDIKMLKGEGIDLSDRPWIDTSMIASLVFPELHSYSLGYVSTVLDLNHEPVHRALGDVQATLELLSKCWERLSELTPELFAQAQRIMERSSPGYKMLFGALPEASSQRHPKWLSMPPDVTGASDSSSQFPIPNPEKPTVQLVEESPTTEFLQQVLNHCSSDESTVHWLAVKNLSATMRVLNLPKNVRVIYPPFLLLDEEAGENLLAQEEFTEDEATLALKLLWYAPTNSDELPIHGDEKAVWNGKLACTEQSPAYVDQFNDLPSVVLLDHRQLLAFLDDPEHKGHGAFTPDAHIIIDNASMLEDTATKAYGCYTSIDDIRAASQGSDLLTKFTDVLQLWIEKVRQFQDVRYLTTPDLTTSETKGLLELLEEVLKTKISPQMQKQFSGLQEILSEDKLKDRIVFTEQRANGSQFLQSAPEHVGVLLKEKLYDQYSVSLMIPPSGGETLSEVLPAGVKTNNLSAEFNGIPLTFPEDTTLDSIMRNPPEGKTAILVGSRRTIEDAFNKYTELLEENNVTLICQNLSGGRGRMQAEFTAAEGKTLWLITPWLFESLELPSSMIDHLILHTLPFDHPSHPIFSRRAEHFRDPFNDYSLPRLEHRLFRLLRSFYRYRAPGGDVMIIDERLRTKRYGKRISNYLEQFAGEEDADKKEEGQLKMF